MNDTLRTLYAFNHSYCQQLLTDISEEEMLLQPQAETSAGVNTPAWLLGHLAVCTDFALAIMGQEKKLAPEWGEYFGINSKPTPGDSTWPSKQELWDAYSAGHQLVEAASHDINAKLMAKPNPVDLLIPTLPTAGDLLSHLMATHESFHLGNLSNWRRQMGRKPLF